MWSDMWSSWKFYALTWLAVSIGFFALSARLYNSAISPHSSAKFLAFGLLFFSMFLRTIIKRDNLQVSQKYPEKESLDVGDGLTDLQRIERILRAFSRTGLPFKRGAKDKVINQIVEHFPEERATHSRILDCVGGLLFLKHLYHKNMAAAHADSPEQIDKAVTKLSPGNGNSIYHLNAHHMQIFVRADDDRITRLNKYLQFSGLHFRPLS